MVPSLEAPLAFLVLCVAATFISPNTNLQEYKTGDGHHQYHRHRRGNARGLELEGVLPDIELQDHGREPRPPLGHRVDVAEYPTEHGYDLYHHEELDDRAHLRDRHVAVHLEPVGALRLRGVKQVGGNRHHPRQEEYGSKPELPVDDNAHDRRQPPPRVAEPVRRQEPQTGGFESGVHDAIRAVEVDESDADYRYSQDVW